MPHYNDEEGTIFDSAWPNLDLINGTPSLEEQSFEQAVDSLGNRCQKAFARYEDSDLIFLHALREPSDIDSFSYRPSTPSDRSSDSLEAPALSSGSSTASLPFGSCSSDCNDHDSTGGRCPHPECGRLYRDLQAHLLTHQNERPEKCPVDQCPYQVRGFARKYDLNRHVLTHYKGNVACGFCPGIYSASERSFGRIDVFKRHLTSVHAVEQIPPSSRGKPRSSIDRASTKTLGATGQCSICSTDFANAQNLYDHLDECVLFAIQDQRAAAEPHDERTQVASVQNDVPGLQEQEQQQVLLKGNLAVAARKYLISHHLNPQAFFDAMKTLFRPKVPQGCRRVEWICVSIRISSS